VTAIHQQRSEPECWLKATKPLREIKARDVHGIALNSVDLRAEMDAHGYSRHVGASRPRSALCGRRALRHVHFAAAPLAASGERHVHAVHVLACTEASGRKRRDMRPARTAGLTRQAGDQLLSKSRSE